jgi:hypothetical protein
MSSLGRKLSWLIVLIAGLAPMLVYFVAGVVGRASRRKAGRPPARPAPTRAKEDDDR